MSDGPRLETANRTQIQLRPFDLESILPEDHRARAMWAVVEGLDLAGFYEPIKARDSRPGRSATDPKILLCLWLYGTSEGVGSARRLARLCQEHDAYRWILGGVTTNHHTLADFRVGHAQRLDELLTQLLAVLMKQKLVKLRRVAQDGMRVRANAGAASFRRGPTLEECLTSARAHVARVKREADEPDATATAREQAARERAAREREARVARALRELPKAQAAKKPKEREQARVSTTDPEARVMKMGDGGFRPAYNVQLATDVESRFVVGVHVTNAGTDMGQMVPMLDDIERRTGERPVEHLVDGGFAKREAITEAAERGVTVYAPVSTPKKNDVDPHEAKPNDTAAVAEWRQRMATDEAKAIYKERAATAETVNADLRIRTLDRLLVRGTDKVMSVALWAALTYNLMHWISVTA
jgi:transposase